MTGATTRGGARILLVEDDEQNRALVRAMLARCAEPRLRHACLVEARDLAQARAALAGAPVDLVLLDMRLPDGSGMALAAELRDAGGGRPPAVVAVTGESAPSLACQAKAAGCQAVLTKPYTMADLCGMLGTLIRGDHAASDAEITPCADKVTPNYYCK